VWIAETALQELTRPSLAAADSFRWSSNEYPWDPLHRAYFNGEALWTYLTTPFVLATSGVRIQELKPCHEEGERWWVIRARFPGPIETHSQVQGFFLGPDLMLQRHDYQVNVAGGFAASQLTSDYVSVQGISLPTRRRACARGCDRRFILDMLVVSIDIADVTFSWNALT
jgi:hypothetical protein